jgi:iron complex transport system substrate-binding protein
MEAIQDLHADIIIDYGSIDARYVTLADKIQSATGIPYLVLDGRLTKVPDVVGRLGSILHREERARDLRPFAPRTQTFGVSGCRRCLRRVANARKS